MKKFKQWVQEFGGQVAVARALGISSPGVNRWCQGQAVPSLKNAVAIVKLAKGQLTIDDLVEEFVGHDMREREREALRLERIELESKLTQVKKKIRGI